MNQKRLFLISIAIIALVAVGLLIYFSFLQRSSSGDINIGDDNSNLLPFGSTDRDRGIEEGSRFLEDADEFDVEEQGVERYIKISSVPVAGLGWGFYKEHEGLLYTDRSAGHVFLFDTETGQSERISNTTIPRVQESFFSADGKHVVLRYLDDSGSLITYSAKIGEETGSLEQGEFLQVNLRDFVVSPSTENVFYLLRRTFGSGGIISDFDGAPRNEIVSLDTKSWRLQWFNKNQIGLTTKPSLFLEGFLYYLNTSTGVLDKVLGGINGLTTTVSPTGNNVIYSETSSSGFITYLYNKSSESNNLLFIKTSADKCAWSSDSAYCGVPKRVPLNRTLPDSWYTGEVSFDDTIWTIDPETLESKQILDPQSSSGEAVDLINPTTSKDGDWLFYINKKDLSLWGLRVSDSSSI